MIYCDKGLRVVAYMVICIYARGIIAGGTQAPNTLLYVFDEIYCRHIL